MQSHQWIRVLSFGVVGGLAATVLACSGDRSRSESSASSGSTARESPLYDSRLSASLRRFDDSLVSAEDVRAAQGATSRAVPRVSPTPAGRPPAPAGQPPTSVSNAAQAIDKGRRAFDEERWEEAVAFFEAAIAAEPGNSLVYSYRADALFRLHRFDEAIASYQQARDLNPSFVFPLYGIAGCHYANGDLDAALSTYRKILRLRPDDKTARSQIAVLEQRLGEQEDRQDLPP